MSKAIQQLRAHFAPREDPYAGGDMDNARRLGSVLWGMGVTLTVLLLPISPPTDRIGAAGWLVAGAVVAGGLAAIYGLRSRHWINDWRSMFAACCGSVLGLSAMQWLAGGLDAPYEHLYLLPILFVAALDPPRRIAAFMGLVLVALAAPFFYDGWSADAFGSAAASYVIWWVIALIANLLMTGVRAQRLALSQEGEEAREEARRDPLTGLGNRRAFDETAAREIVQARRLKIPLSMMLADVERFKAVNDDFGHLEGDRCLREVAIAIRSQLRQPDLCFRWGGDEFAILLTGTDASGAKLLSDRLGAAVSEACLRPDDEPVVIRFGVAELGRHADLVELVELADLSLSAERSAAEPERSR